MRKIGLEHGAAVDLLQDFELGRDVVDTHCGSVERKPF